MRDEAGAEWSAAKRRQTPRANRFLSLEPRFARPETVAPNAR
jgi:hypothetical protein